MRPNQPLWQCPPPWATLLSPHFTPGWPSPGETSSASCLRIELCLGLPVTPFWSESLCDCLCDPLISRASTAPAPGIAGMWGLPPGRAGQGRAGGSHSSQWVLGCEREQRRASLAPMGEPQPSQVQMGPLRPKVQGPPTHTPGTHPPLLPLPGLPSCAVQTPRPSPVHSTKLAEKATV